MNDEILKLAKEQSYQEGYFFSPCDLEAFYNSAFGKLYSQAGEEMTTLDRLEALADAASADGYGVELTADTLKQMIALIRQMEGALKYYDFGNGVPQRALNALKEFDK